MVINNTSALLQHEEKRALKIYLTSFYITLVLFDVVYFVIYKKLKVTPGFSNKLSLINYLFYFGLLILSFYLFKIGKQTLIKYIYVLTYFSLALIYDCIVFIDNPAKYASGNAAELILVLFSPLFINKRFFWVTSLAAILRYIIVGGVIHSSVVLIPISLVLVLSIVAYILLARFNSYTKALTETHEELRDKEKLAFVGQMATTIGHEIRNPLASLKGFTQLQREKHKEDDLQYSIMEQEIDRIDSILTDLLVIGKPRQINVAPCNLKEHLRYVISIIEQSEQGKNIEVTLKLDESFPLVECDEKQMKQVFLNLIKNGFESMPEGGALTIEGSQVDDNQVSIKICDDGCGIPRDVQEKLFQPFYTTKDYGTGLGLMVSKKIIEDHHGKIAIESKEGKGTKVEILLPITQ
ncbi:sensor histidine kinase [Bacillus sp. HNG]|uniref:ATP-binding protein n=1 Tax=Bacillus sp. HNG TaxID=2293325 RepID=UPI000E2F803B|nr:ATP-binding protein [Bacillus sp. HNG]RFB13431.1 sensor histidine kinase [Bacillus sp. HNG]